MNVILNEGATVEAAAGPCRIEQSELAEVLDEEDEWYFVLLQNRQHSGWVCRKEVNDDQNEVTAFEVMDS